jgi:hypothetical protein
MHRLQTLSTWTILLHASLVFAFSPPRGLRLRVFQRDRFFSEEHLLAPLDSSSSHLTAAAAPSNATVDTMSTWTLPYSSQDHTVNGAALPVLYSNDPKMVNRWLTQHLPMDVCAVGFDTEVRTVLMQGRKRVVLWSCVEYSLPCTLHGYS